MGLQNGQWLYRSLLMGEASDYDVDEVVGIRGFKGRDSSVFLPRGDGQVPGRNYLRGKTVTMRVRAYGVPDTSDQAGKEQDLETAFQVSQDDQFDLNYKRAGWPEQRIIARPISVDRVLRHSNERGSAPYILTLQASDPRTYGIILSEVVVPIFDTSKTGGLDYPVDYPKNYNQGSSAGATALIGNAGNATAWPVIEVAGPTDGGTLTSIQLLNLTNGDEIIVNTQVLAAQVLRIDMTALVTGSGELVVSIDGSTRYNDWELPRAPFGLEPGTNELRFNVSGTTEAAVCSVSAYDTWK